MLRRGSQLDTRKPTRGSSRLNSVASVTGLFWKRERGSAVAWDSCHVSRTSGRWVAKVLGCLTEQRQDAVNSASQIPGDSRVRERARARARNVGRFFKGKAGPSSTAGFAVIGAAFLMMVVGARRECKICGARRLGTVVVCGVSFESEADCRCWSLFRVDCIVERGRESEDCC